MPPLHAANGIFTGVQADVIKKRLSVQEQAG
jgi:hypothetical protein